MTSTTSELWKPEYGLVRKGGCIRCGRCCASRINVCPYFSWKSVKDIPKGVLISETGEGTSLEAVCLAHDLDLPWCPLESRRAFPSTPHEVRGRCGYWFETEDGRKVVSRIIEGRSVLIVE